MARKVRTSSSAGKAVTPKLEAAATAKLEAVAKASYEHKKSVTEVIPPDVTRAKVGRWLDFISPITEWNGLKGDAIRYRRQQLRIQQEAALETLALLVKKKTLGRTIESPLEAKFLVPALEAASLEHEQSPLLDWWADLLVSGATGRKIRPYFVELMKTIGSEEAALLDELWKSFSSFDVDRRLIRDYLSLKFKELYEQIDELDDEKKNDDPEHGKKIFEMYEEWRKKMKLWTEARGMILLVNFTTSGCGSWDLSFDSSKDEALDVCIATNIVARQDFKESGKLWQLGAIAIYFSELGVEFMTACRPNIEIKHWSYE